MGDTACEMQHSGIQQTLAPNPSAYERNDNADFR